MLEKSPGFKTYLFEFRGYGRWLSLQGAVHHSPPGCGGTSSKPSQRKAVLQLQPGAPSEPLSPTQAQPDRGPQASEDGSDDFSETATHSRAWDRVGPSSPPGMGSMPSWGRRAESQSIMRTTAAVPSRGVRPQLCPAMCKPSSHAEIHPRPRLGQDVHFNPRFSASGITPEAS